MPASPPVAVGFGDPVLDSQTTFRALMTALAEPGRIVPLPVAPAGSPLPAGLAAVLVTLCDYETPVWLAPSLRGSAETHFVRFATGAPIIAAPDKAAFAFASDFAELPGFDAFAPGTLEYPDRSTTLVVHAEGLAATGPFRLSGPGIDGERALAVPTAPTDLVERLAANRALFPRGIDLILVGGGVVVGLPRTTRVRREG